MDTQVTTRVDNYIGAALLGIATNQLKNGPTPLDRQTGLVAIMRVMAEYYPEDWAEMRTGIARLVLLSLSDWAKDNPDEYNAMPAAVRNDIQVGCQYYGIA